MALNLSMPEQHDLRPRITVFGVGGAGGNAVNNMIEKNLEGAEFVVANTDAQALAQNNAPQKIQLGVEVTQGLGAGARPEVGSAAAEESIETIVDQLSGAHMCFITAGMGGGTGTGAAPIIARAAREMGVLTVGVVTKPFQFEGARRMRQAEEGVEELQRVVDTLIVIPNQNLFRLANEKTTFTEAFSMADDVLYQGVKGVTDLMVRPGIINLDFADIRSVMDEMGKAMMGTGEADGEDRAVQAAEKAIANPLLDEISLKGARGVLINVTGGTDLTLFELDEAANRIRSEVDPDANIIVGSTLDPQMDGKMRVSVVATGIEAKANREDTPVSPRTWGAKAPKPAPVQEPEAVEEIPAGPSFVDAQVEEPTAARAAAPAQGFAHAPQEPPVTHQHVEPQAELPSLEATAYDQARRPGEPTPEAMRRLQAAVSAVPEGTRAASAARSAPVAAQPTRSRPAQPEEGGRFAINSLIHRMTGHGSRDERDTAHRQQPPVTSREDDQAAEPRDPHEIPAFLRRQAN
ncbi:cell division protein FtsZ [Oceanibium sediminis]|uniref:cell division protein FtsZ n=1 Tax=Oceanibium sediminis TaxID=2026339 RepID=UPI000DD444F6|nr:cell division protein FtsZ [Oceanibium sediminis]